MGKREVCYDCSRFRVARFLGDGFGHMPSPVELAGCGSSSSGSSSQLRFHSSSSDAGRTKVVIALLYGESTMARSARTATSGIGGSEGPLRPSVNDIQGAGLQQPGPHRPAWSFGDYDALVLHATLPPWVTSPGQPHKFSWSTPPSPAPATHDDAGQRLPP